MPLDQRPHGKGPLDPSPESQVNPPAGSGTTRATEDLALQDAASAAQGQRENQRSADSHSEPLAADRESINQNINYSVQVDTPAAEPADGLHPSATAAAPAGPPAGAADAQDGPITDLSVPQGAQPASEARFADGAEPATPASLSFEVGNLSGNGLQRAAPSSESGAGTEQPDVPAQPLSQAAQALAGNEGADRVYGTRGPWTTGEADRNTAADAHDDGTLPDDSSPIGGGGGAPLGFALDNDRVEENSADGSAVAQIALSSPGAGEPYGYQLLDDAGGRFALDGGGRLTVADGALLDREAADSHQVTIRVTDGDGSTSLASFTIAVEDVNEAPTDISLDSDSIVESAAAGALVGSLSTSDPENPAETFTYSLVDDAGGRFAIDADGRITVAGPGLLDFEVSTSHDIAVRVTDSAGNSLTESFTIHIANANEFAVGALTDSDGTANSVAESAANGTAVGVTALAADADATDTVTYSLTDNAGGRFAIDANSGVITVADSTLLDYETATSHAVTVKATSSDGSTSTQTFTISLTDDTSEATIGAVTDSDGASNTVSENAANGTAVGVIALASDADVTDSITYSLIDSAGGRFAIDASSGVITVADSSQLDYEAATSHTVTVKAISSDGSTSTETFTINLSDDTSEAAVGTVTDGDATANYVSESAASGTAVGVTALASDADVTDSVTYSLIDDAGGRFTIDANNGVVTVADSSLLDYETATSHTVTVKATSSDGSTSTETFTINLTDDAFEAGVSAISDGDGRANSVAESAATGTAVGVTALASDADATDTVTYSLTDSAGGRFAIDDNSGVITVAGSTLLDYEMATSHSVTVKATSTDGSSSTETFTINLTDDTSEAAVGAISDNDGAGNSVSESAVNGTAVGVTALASDSDATDSVTYSLTDSAGGRFAIDANSGVITIADNSLLDYEAATSHTVTVKATSTDDSTSTEVFTINLSDDTSEAAVGTVTDSDATANSVSESAANGTAVGVTALSGDADATDSVTYSLVNNAGGRFAIDANSGVITVADSSLLDYEAATSHSVTVKATSTDGSTSTESFTINLTDDTSEAVAGAVTDNDGAANSVSERAAKGTAVGITALATDADTSDTVTYSLTDDAAGRFAIDANSGVVTVADSSLLDYESATNHFVTVRATSSDGSTSTESFTINLTDDTGEAGVSAISDDDGAANSVSESAANGAAVGITALASDADATDTVTYSFVDNAGGRFAIDANSGIITVADSSLLDYESATSHHTVTVKATSSDGSTSTQSFTINLSDDTAEAAVGAISDSDGTANSVSENAVNGTIVGITALAADADASDTVTYSLTDDAGGRFTIDAASGVITVADGSLLDYESATSHSVTVRATSTDGSTSTQGFTIDLTNGFEVTPTGMTVAGNDALTAPGGGNTIAGGTAVADITSVIDSEPGDSFTFALTDDAGGAYQIDASSGEILLVSDLDVSSASSDTVTVQVADAGGNTYEETITIHYGTSGSDSITGGAGKDIIYGLGGSGSSGSGSVTIGNASFESPGLSDGDASYYNNSRSWTGSGNKWGYWDPEGSWGMSAHSGQNIAMVFGNSKMTQTLSTNFDSGKDYTLSVKVGNLQYDPGHDWAGSGQQYAIRVYAGGTLIGETTGTEPSYGNWDSVMVDINGSDYEAADGGALRIELVNTSSYSDHDHYIAFDAVQLDYTSPEETLSGGGGDDYIVAGDSGAVLSGDAGDDVLIGGDGDDTLNGGDGADFLIGGAGADSMDGGADVDTVDYSNAGSGIVAAFQATDGNGIGGTYTNTGAGGHLGDANGDSFANIENFIGTDYADRVFGAASGMTFDLGAGDDTFDTSSAAIADTVYAGDGADTVWTGGGNDVVFGGAGNDRLSGEAGDDTLVGGLGDDEIYGSSGSDLFIFQEGGGSDTIHGGAGGGWTDTIQLQDASGGSNIGNYGADWTVSLSTGSIQGQGAGYIDLSDDAAGTITLQDGSQVTFEDIERIEW